MPTEGIGVYGLGTAALLNDEISSTYEGRHLTFLEADITGHEHAFPTVGHPVVVSNTAAPDFGHIVGVALSTATAIGDLVAIDTEGIWYLSVDATVGHGPVTHGDDLYIDRNSAIISNDLNKNTHTHFGYALGGVAEGVVATIAVKVHWDPDDAEEKVGVTGVPYVNDRTNVIFRQYYYDAGGGGLIEGERMELSPTASCVTACVDYRKLILNATIANTCTGRASVIEARLEITAGGVAQDTMACLALDFSNACTIPINNWHAAYIQCRERSNVGRRMNNIINFSDITPIAGDSWSLLCTDATPAQHTHTLKFIVSGVAYWFQITNAPPT